MSGANNVYVRKHITSASAIWTGPNASTSFSRTSPKHNQAKEENRQLKLDLTNLCASNANSTASLLQQKAYKLLVNTQTPP